MRLPFSRYAAWFQIDTALLVKVLTICSNLSSNLVIEGGSNLAPPLHVLEPWGAGTFSLNPPHAFLDQLGTDCLASSLTTGISIKWPISLQYRQDCLGLVTPSFPAASLRGTVLPQKWLASARLLVTSIS